MITIDFNRLNIKSGYRILDIGCGTGRHICAATKFSRVFAIGVDINFDDLNEARNRLIFQEKLGENGGRWNILAADVASLPFADNFFDLIVFSEVLEHIHNQKRAINELVRILKPGQNMAVSVPRYWPEKICWKLSKEYRNTNNGHIRIYKKKELVGALETAGLEQWASHWAHSIHTPYWWLKCLIGPAREDSAFVNLYHRFLTWDIMKRPRLTRFLDTLLNPVLGKSIVLYLRKKRREGSEKRIYSDCQNNIPKPTLRRICAGKGALPRQSNELHHDFYGTAL